MERDAGIQVFDGIIKLGGTAWLQWQPHVKQYTVSILDSEIRHETLEAILKIAAASGAKAKFAHDRIAII